jgi:pyruvate,water dikinase
MEPVQGTSGSRLRPKEIQLAGNPIARLWFRVVLDRARQFRLFREQVSFLYTYAYGLFRPYFLALGKSFTARGLLSMPEDIFYLSRDEVRKAVSMVSGVYEMDYQRLTRARKDEMERCHNITLPPLVFGDVAPLVEVQPGEKLYGVPTSRGYSSGPVQVVRGLGDFAKVQPGDILVIPYSDVSWTPLFARVGAVIAESGGMLSHSSIIAREYQIPAVVSVAGAMRLQDKTWVTVDGYRGEITLRSPNPAGLEVEQLAIPEGEE